MKTVSAALSDVGLKRPHNEDFHISEDDVGLYIVADGVGGHAKGEVASQEAVEQTVMWVHEHLGEMDRLIAKGDAESVGRVRRTLESGVQNSCYMIYGLAELDPEKRGMSTTMSVLLARGGKAFVAQVGDSRVYRLRGGALAQMTEDHTLINFRLKQGLITPEEAKRATGKNVITRAVGHKDYVQVDTFESDMLPGDRFLLCSDGLHGPVEDVELEQLMAVNPLEAAVKKCIDLANKRGGKDNITAVLVAFGT
jgi:serine/threonine protein phosphatase PrpC